MLASTELFIKDFDTQFYNQKKIERLIELIIKEQNLGCFITDFNVVDKRARFLGVYYPRVSTLNINMGGIQKAYDHHLRENNIRFGTATSTRHYNLLVLNTILHEITHANQVKESISPKNDSLHQIIREGVKLGSKFPYRITPHEAIVYRFFYNDILIERQAEFNALSTILKLDDENSFLSPREHAWVSRKLISIILRGYSKHLTPVLKYYLLRNKMEEYNHLQFDGEYTSEEILGWGMPTNSATLDYLKHELDEREPNLNLILKP